LISASKSPHNALPVEVANFARGIDVVYFANALIVDKSSQELLAFSKLTAGGIVTTATSTCCGTLMCFSHPLYEGTTISVSTDSCHVTTSSSLPLQAVVYVSDIPDEYAQTIIRCSAVPVISSVNEEPESPVIKALVRAVTTPISTHVRAAATTNFEKMCASKPLMFAFDRAHDYP